MAKSAYEHVKAWRARPESKSKRAAQARRWRARHPDVFRAIKARHREGHIEEIRVRDAEMAREYRKTPEYKEKARIRTERFRAKRAKEQEAIAGRPKPNVCEICQTDEFRIVFDHCHVGGHFRGWICDRCNRTLGLVRDGIELLKAMTGYLEAHQRSNRKD